MVLFLTEAKALHLGTRSRSMELVLLLVHQVKKKIQQDQIRWKEQVQLMFLNVMEVELWSLFIKLFIGIGLQVINLDILFQ